jgi:hypothetical protein
MGGMFMCRFDEAYAKSWESIATIWQISTAPEKEYGKERLLVE